MCCKDIQDISYHVVVIHTSTTTITTTNSPSSSQFIIISLLLAARSDWNLYHCNEHHNINRLVLLHHSNSNMLYTNRSKGGVHDSISSSYWPITFPLVVVWPRRLAPWIRIALLYSFHPIKHIFCQSTQLETGLHCLFSRRDKHFEANLILSRSSKN